MVTLSIRRSSRMSLGQLLRILDAQMLPLLFLAFATSDGFDPWDGLHILQPGFRLLLEGDYGLSVDSSQSNVGYWARKPFSFDRGLLKLRRSWFWPSCSGHKQNWPIWSTIIQVLILPLVMLDSSGVTKTCDLWGHRTVDSNAVVSWTK